MFLKRISKKVQFIVAITTMVVYLSLGTVAFASGVWVDDFDGWVQGGPGLATIDSWSIDSGNAYAEVTYYAENSTSTPGFRVNLEKQVWYGWSSVGYHDYTATTTSTNKYPSWSSLSQDTYRLYFSSDDLYNRVTFYGDAYDGTR